MSFIDNDPGSVAAPEASDLWDAIPPECEVRRCNACHLVFLMGWGQQCHWLYCPENRHRIRPGEPLPWAYCDRCGKEL